MFCPECGEVIGSGPLDVRRARYVRNGGKVKALGRWVRAIVRRVRTRKR
ncbi:hypothetical protein SAMN06295937_103624 [Sphingopyxis flava]|uniref:Uncharacterized protein n=1 Tax=Sphingopyxis flava TaxID=1507287 RepID=A0A1T5FIH9_9SPHN|nr:hypothetical protein SAMN06295937_103624 [Sphingopyxis flava]